MVGCPGSSTRIERLIFADHASAVWQWEQLRIMKVGGNESATKFFQSNGGSAALASKDPKVKYASNAATKYKEELKRLASIDAQRSGYRAQLFIRRF
jgi:hypothetical protein